MKSKLELCLGDSVTVFTPLGRIEIDASRFTTFDLVLVDVYGLVIGTTVRSKTVDVPGAYIELERKK